jgi:hypothetical protein
MGLVRNRRIRAGDVMSSGLNNFKNVRVRFALLNMAAWERLRNRRSSWTFVHVPA